MLDVFLRNVWSKRCLPNVQPLLLYSQAPTTVYRLNDSVIIFFAEQVKKKNAEQLTLLCTSYPADHTVVVSKKFSSAALVILGKCSGRMEFFTHTSLFVDLSRNRLCCKYVPLSEREVQQVEHQHVLHRSQLPKLLSTDPAAKLLGLKNHTVVRLLGTEELRYVVQAGE